MRFDITVERRGIMGPMIDCSHSHNDPESGPPDRTFFEAVLQIARTGEPWRELPEQFGHGTPSTTAFAVGASPAGWNSTSSG